MGRSYTPLRNVAHVCMVHCMSNVAREDEWGTIDEAKVYSGEHSQIILRGHTDKVTLCAITYGTGTEVELTPTAARYIASWLTAHADLIDEGTS